MENDASSRQKGQPPDVWADGAAYERYVGRWSRIVARQFLAWLAVAPNRRWLDVGCGTGILTRAILEHAQPAGIQGIDRSLGFVAFARQQARDPRVRFDVADAQQLAVEPGGYDAVVSGLMLNFLSQPDIAVGSMAGAARAGATVAAYVWDYAGNMQIMSHFWEAAAALNPAALELYEKHRFPLCQPQPLADLFRSFESDREARGKHVN